MKVHMKKTLRNVMAATVASGLLLTACGNSDANRQQPKMDTSNLRPPVNNPQAGGEGAMAVPQGMRAPEANPQGVSAPKAQAAPVAPAASYAEAPAAQPQQKSGGMFDWMWKEKQPESPVNTMERRVPALNQGAVAQADTGLGAYQAAAPVAEVETFESYAQLSPQGNIVVADEVIMMDDTFTPIEQVAPAPAAAGYPNLGSVPLRPERVDAINEKDARMADLSDARAQSVAQGQALNAQIEADSEGSLMPWQDTAVAQAPVEQGDMDAEFAALVAADGHGEQVVILEENVRSVAVDQAPAPVAVASAQPWDMPLNAPAADSGWQPAPLEPQAQSHLTPQAQPYVTPQAQQFAAPQEQALAPQVAAAPQENEWVSLQQDPVAQMAVPVEQVDIAHSPEIAAVSSIPVVPQGEMAGDIQLTPPSAFGNSVRTLPDSRYASRRQAVYMQRYSRMQQAGGF